ncbi:cytochrome p450 [Moniliophthora roreri]|uniref:Cytochrome p450 n=1 Tax=Moniliophthora roreri TaxID=221103 RepID=A0A0W0G6X8_MONRR|nr:cytochrome p450 [Moniliophthora roreri]
MDQLNSFSYLDAAIRETLRYYAPVPFTSRAAVEDDIVPLAEPHTNRKNAVQHRLKVKRGTQGADADDFSPSRWENLPEAVSPIPGVWGNMLTFLGDPHAYIGWRFSLVEMKALLFILARSSEFVLAVPREEVMIRKSARVQRLEVIGQGKLLPLIIKHSGSRGRARSSCYSEMLKYLNTRQSYH